MLCLEVSIATPDKLPATFRLLILYYFLARACSCWQFPPPPSHLSLSWLFSAQNKAQQPSPAASVGRVGPSPSSCWQRGTWHPLPVQLCAGATCGFSPKQGKFPPRRPAPCARWGGSRGKPLAGAGLGGSSPPPPEMLFGRGSLLFHSCIPAPRRDNVSGALCWAPSQSSQHLFPPLLAGKGSGVVIATSAWLSL